MVERYKSLLTDDISFDDNLTWQRLHQDLEESRARVSRWVEETYVDLEKIATEISAINDKSTMCSQSCYIGDVDNTLNHLNALLQLRGIFRNRKMVTATTSDVTAIYSLEEIKLLAQLTFVQGNIVRLSILNLGYLATAIKKSIVVLGTRCVSDDVHRELVHYYYSLSDHGKLVLAAFFQSESPMIEDVASALIGFRNFHPNLKPVLGRPLGKQAEFLVDPNELTRITAKKLVDLLSMDVPEMVTPVRLFPAGTRVSIRADTGEERAIVNEEPCEIPF